MITGVPQGGQGSAIAGQYLNRVHIKVHIAALQD